MDKILQRFIDVWKLDFLAKLVAGEHNDHKTTIGFWFLFNALVALLFTVSFGFFLFGFEDELTTSIVAYVPDQATISVIDGKLYTENIDEPFFREIDAQNEYNGVYAGKYLIAIDTTSEVYDITSLDEYIGGTIILHDRMFVKNGNEVKQMLFVDVPNFTLTKEQVLLFIDEKFLFPIVAGVVAVVFLSLFIGYSVFRLAFALWWALMLFILAKVFDVRLGYVIAYKAVLNFYFIPTLVVFLFSFVIMQIPLLVTSIFIVIFIANLWWMKKNTIAEEDVNAVKEGEQEIVVNTVEKS